MQEFCRAKYKCKKESVTSYSSFTLKAIISLMMRFIIQEQDYIGSSEEDSQATRNTNLYLE